jgi:hypothetical protein
MPAAEVWDRFAVSANDDDARHRGCHRGEAQKHMPEMIKYLEEGEAQPDAEADLHRCAQRCGDLFAGRYGIFSGRYMERPDDIDACAEEAANQLKTA